MLSWQVLNARGKLCYALCIINLAIAFTLVVNGHLIGLCHAVFAMLLGLATYDPRNQKENDNKTK